MKKCLLYLLLGLSLLTSGWSKLAESSENRMSALEPSRLSTLWIGGQRLGDMIIGARAQMTFFYVDSRVISTLDSTRNVPRWLSWNAQYYGESRKRGGKLLILCYKAILNWKFTPGEICIGKYKISRNDIFTDDEYIQDGDLPPGTKGTLAFMVPKKYLQAGRMVELRYGDYSIMWKVPRR